jgi:hypothetical protein
MRPSVAELILLGPFPDSASATAEDLDRRGELLKAISRPVSEAEARGLLACFGPDDAYGLAWSLLHLIETAPTSPVKVKPAETANEWIRCLWDRSHRDD